MAITDTVDRTWLTKRYLFGINLTDDNGAAYPDEMFEHAVKGAAREVGAALGVSLEPLTVVDERHDTDGSSSESYGMTCLAKRPVWSVDAFKVQYGAFEPSTLPVEWVTVRSAEGGMIQLLPARQSLAYTLSGLTGAPMSMLMGGGSRYVPGFHLFSYTAGYGSEEHPYPEELLTLVGLKGAMLILDTAGDLIAGAGVASKSMSMDGISESINTTSSATNAGYGARIIAYQKRYDALLRDIYRDYHPVDMFAF